MEYILGIDIGTSSSKAVAWSLKNKVIDTSYQTYPTLHPQPGYSEQSPDKICQAVFSIINKIVQQHGQPACVCFSAAMHSIMAIDKKGDPLTPILLWSDTRSQPVADKLRHSKAGKKIYEHTGTPIHAMSPLCKLMWWKDQRPDWLKKAVRFISIKEYVLQKIVGEYIVDYSIASATGMFDIRKLTWYKPALTMAGITKDNLSDILSPGEKIKASGKLRKLKLDKNIPIIIGASDGCLANLGSGAIRKGDMALTIGTSGAVRMFSHQPITDTAQSLFCYLLNEKEYIVGGAINNGGVLLDWYMNEFEPNSSKKEYNYFVKKAMSVKAGSEGLLFLPYLLGERSPMWDALARGAFIGIHINHQQAHFMRAMLEGIAYALNDVCHILANEVSPIKRVIASGGFTNSSAWAQLVADVLGKKLTVHLSEPDASCMGAVIIGGIAMGIWNNKEEALKQFQLTSRFIHPDKKNYRIYQKYNDIYHSLYPLLKITFGELNQSQY